MAWEAKIQGVFGSGPHRDPAALETRETQAIREASAMLYLRRKISKALIPAMPGVLGKSPRICAGAKIETGETEGEMSACLICHKPAKGELCRKCYLARRINQPPSCAEEIDFPTHAGQWTAELRLVRVLFTVEMQDNEIVAKLEPPQEGEKQRWHPIAWLKMQGFHDWKPSYGVKTA